MKKFTLLSAIAALATVGSVFAAWEFTTTTASVDADGSASISVTVDKDVLISGGLTGTAKMTTKEGSEGTVSAGQKTTNKGDVVFAEKGSVADSYTITYSPGTNEQAASYNAVVTITASGIDWATTSWTVTKALSNGSVEVTLAELLAKVNEATINLGDSAAAVDAALDTFNPSFTVSAKVEYTGVAA